MDPPNKDIKILLASVITRLEKNEKENEKISGSLVTVKDELKDINLELDTILGELIANDLPIKLDAIEKRKLTVLNHLNSMENQLEKDEELFDIEFLDTIVGES